jgi:hypothetical protein
MLDLKQEPSGGPAELRRNLQAADPATLLLCLVQLTGERQWLEDAQPFIRGPMNYQEFMPEELRDAIRDRLAEVLAAPEGRAGDRPPDDALLSEMMTVATGERVGDDYIAMMREDLTLDTLASRSLSWRKRPDASALDETQVVIIGAGMSGLYAGIQLQQAGIPFVILEKNGRSAAPGSRTAIPAAASTRRTTFIPMPSSPTTTGRTSSPSATSCGTISSASRTSMICASTSASRPKSTRRAMTRRKRAGTSSRMTRTAGGSSFQRASWCPPSAC